MKYAPFVFLLLLCSCTPMEVSDDVFEFFWSEMDRKYAYFDEKGIDWNGIYSACHRRAKAADKAALLQVFQEIIDTLKDGHVSLSTPDTMLYYDLGKGKDEIVTMYNIANYYDFPLREEFDADSSYNIVQLSNDITFISLYNFNSRFSFQYFQTVMASYACSKGIIINVRGNRGGDLRNVAEWSSCFFTGRCTAFYEKHKIGSGHSDFTGYIPVEITGRGVIDEKIPVVLLVGVYTYSGANLFAGIMKYLPNVTLMGTATGGGGSVRHTAVLPNGWRYTYSQAPMYDICYSSLEQGVTPHYNIPSTIKEIEEMQQTGVHKLMEAAYQYLLSK